MQFKDELYPSNTEIITTRDGSPTVKLYCGESMHSHAGALGESLYIYGEALTWAFNNIAEPHLMSVGLGLGYNEFIATALAIKNKKSIFIDSFEVIPELKYNFINSLKLSHEGLLTDILYKVAKHFEIEINDLKIKLLEFIETKKIQISDDVASAPLKKYDLIFYDSFSQKTSPELWSDEFLNSVIDRLKPTSAITTYACVSRFNRLLKAQNFEVTKRPGFASKRDCTFAYRVYR